jgi:pimeloyl-ACP methyl ester carboxylesterase
MASTTRTIDLGDGDSTTLEQWGDSGPAILCVHGIASSRKSWVRTAEALVTPGLSSGGAYRVFAYDQRGHGDSAAVPGPMTHAQSVRDLLAVSAAIGGEIFALLGHSWGGAIVLHGARELACVRAIAIDPMIRAVPGTWAAEFVDDLVPLLSSPENTRAAAVREMFAGSAPVEIEAKVHALAHMTIAPIVALGTDNGADNGQWDLREVVRAYPKPLLMMLADPSDSVVSPEDVAFVRQNGGPKLTVEVFEGEGHTLHRSAFEAYLRSVNRFLSQG